MATAVELYRELVEIKSLSNSERSSKSKFIWGKINDLNELQCRSCNNLLELCNYNPKKKANLKSGYKAYDNICKKCRAKKLYNERRSKYNTLDKVLLETVNGIKRRSGVLLDTSYILDIYNSQDGLCYYTKIKMVFDPNSLFKVSADRLNSSITYVDGNIVLCCWGVNNMKQGLSIDDFKMLISKLYQEYV